MGSKTKLIHIDVFFEPGNLTITCLKRRSPFWELYVRTLPKEFLLSFVYVLLVLSLSVSLLFISSLSSPCRLPLCFSPPCFPLIGAPFVYFLLVLPWSVTFCLFCPRPRLVVFPCMYFLFVLSLSVSTFRLFEFGFHFSNFGHMFSMFDFFLLPA